MKLNYEVRNGPATRSVEYIDSSGRILFTFDLDGTAILLELSPNSDAVRYRNAAFAVRDFLKKKLGSEVRFWPDDFWATMGGHSARTNVRG